MNQTRFLRKPEVRFMTGLSASTIRRLEIAGQFPIRSKLSKNAVGWLESAVLGWIQARSAKYEKP